MCPDKFDATCFSELTVHIFLERCSEMGNVQSMSSFQDSVPARCHAALAIRSRKARDGEFSSIKHSCIERPTRKPIMILRRALALIIFLLLNAATTAYAQNQAFYWKGSYGRGVGTIPALECPAGKERGGGLCYDACEGDYDMNEAASLCMIECPEGYADNGLVCHWKGSISYIPKSEWDSCKTRTKKSCTKIFGKKTCVGGDCIGGLVTECRDGYKNIAGVCWFNSPVPQGFSGTNLDPMKPSYAPRNPVAQKQVCRDNKILQDGLCYESCRSGFHGIGPVCWADTPKGFVDCFTGYAKNPTACASVMGSQTAAVALPAIAYGALPALKAYNQAKIAKEGKMAPTYLEIGQEMIKILTTKGDDAAKISGDVMQLTLKGESAAASGKIMQLLEFITSPPSVWGLIGKSGLAGVSAGMQPRDYWRTRNTEETFARARDMASLVSICLTAYSVAFTPGVPNPLADGTGMALDIMSAFMWTVYGQN